MNLKLNILKIAAVAVVLCAPAKVESSESFQSQTVQLPRIGSQQTLLPSQDLKVPDEEKLNQKFVLVLKLNDNQINKLRVEGSLVTRIPPKLVNRVGKIRFQGPSSFLSKSLKVDGAKTLKKARLVSVEVDNSILERLPYQPVELSIYESGFDRVRLKFNPLGSVAGKLPTETKPSDGPLTGPHMFVRINSKQGLYGLLKDFETFPITTQFGKVKIPTSELAGIRLNDGDAKQAFVVLKKGDVFSGQIEMETITVQSRWGDKKIKLSDVESLTLAPEFVFLRDAINSKRWQLRSLLPVSPPAARTSGAIVPNPISTQPSQPALAPSVVFPQNQLPIGFPN